MPDSRIPIRLRFLAGGAGSVLMALAVGAATDRAMVMADLAPQLRFAVTSLEMVALLVLPLMWSLEGWVIQPLEALEVLRDQEKRQASDHPALTSRDLPQEMAEMIGHHTQMLVDLETSNATLKAEIARRTAALEVLVDAGDALTAHANSERVVDQLLPLIARLSKGNAAYMVTMQRGRWTVRIRPPGPVPPENQEDLENRVRRLLGHGERLHVEWTEPSDPNGTTVQHLRVLARQALPTGNGNGGPGAVGLLSTAPASLSSAPEDVRRVLATIAAWYQRLNG